MSAVAGPLDGIDPAMLRAWQAMDTLPLPRNAAAIKSLRERGRLDFGGEVAVSLVGDTRLKMPHIYVDPGKKYDFRCVTGLFVYVVVKPGVDAVTAIDQLWPITQKYITLVDVQRQIVGSIVDNPDGSRKLWPRRKGSEPWLAIFG